MSKKREAEDLQAAGRGLFDYPKGILFLFRRVLFLEALENLREHPHLPETPALFATFGSS